MGFWSSFLGAGAAHVINDMKQQEKETQKWNDLFYELSQYEEHFTKWLESVGCNAIYCFDVEAVNNGNIGPEKRKMDAYKRKMEQYISLGGEAELINDLDDLDDAIEMVKYLREKGCLHRQSEFAGALWLIEAKETIEREEAEALVESAGRQVSYSSSQGGIEDTLTPNVKKLFAEFWDDFEDKYYSFDACLDDLVDTADLREKVSAIDTVISGFKLFEAFLMARQMPEKLDVKLFVKILETTEIGKYKRDDAEGLYYSMLQNEDGLWDNIKNVVLPTDEYEVGLFWTYLAAASEEMEDYDYIKDLLGYHMPYIIALASCVQCFVEEDVIEQLSTGYCGGVHRLLRSHLANK